MKSALLLCLILLALNDFSTACKCNVKAMNKTICKNRKRVVAVIPTVKKSQNAQSIVFKGFLMGINNRIALKPATVRTAVSTAACGIQLTSNHTYVTVINKAKANNVTLTSCNSLPVDKAFRILKKCVKKPRVRPTQPPRVRPTPQRRRSGGVRFPVYRP